MKLTLNETAAKFNVRPDVIEDFINNGLIPSKPQVAVGTEFDDTDMYWMEMVNCFIENGSSLEDVQQLIKRCKI